jgi:hypothetical protein
MAGLRDITSCSAGGKRGERVKANNFLSQTFYMNFFLRRTLSQKNVTVLLILTFPRSLYEAAQEFF